MWRTYTAIIPDDNINDRINEMYEFKLVKRDTNNPFGKEHQRVLDDILRLAYYNLKSKKDSYFLMCGTYKDFKNYFIGQKDEDATKNSTGRVLFPVKDRDKDTSSNLPQWDDSKSLYKDFLDFSVEQSKVYKFIVNENIPGLYSFQERYKINSDLIEFDDSLRIRTTCIALTPFELLTSRTHACGIWKIEAITSK